MKRKPRAPRKGRSNCCPAHQLGLAQALRLGLTSLRTFGPAQWEAAATYMLEAMQEPRPCVLCGQPPLVCGLFTPNPPAVWGHRAVLYFLCAACGALPPEELSIRTAAMMARAVMGRTN